MYVIVSPFFKTIFDEGLVYFLPDFLINDIKKWQIVEIPFREKIEIAVVIDILDKINIDFDESKIKSIINIKNENIFLSDYRLILLPFISKYYFTSISNSSNLFFPKNLLAKIKNDKLVFKESKDYKYKFEYNSNLSEKQEQVYRDINNSTNNKNLLYWLTWSWKTEIYIKLIKQNLDNNKQSLFLIPEIILSNQLFKRIVDVFWTDVIVINSTVTDAVKTKYWLDINFNKAKIIIWTRSSLFYPYNNLWLIIIDEEHDSSYISDQSPRYNSIEIAEKITKLNWNKLLLASWTPSIKSMYKAIKKDYNLITLFEVFGK